MRCKGMPGEDLCCRGHPWRRWQRRWWGRRDGMILSQKVYSFRDKTNNIGDIAQLYIIEV